MTGLEFVDATKEQAFGRVAIEGPSGSGKTWTALLIARVMAEGDLIGVVDTEHGSASKYASDFKFKRINLTPPFTPERYIAAITAAARAGIRVLIIDSLSHEWDGVGGILELVDTLKDSKYRGNKWQAWSEATPVHNKLIDAILRANMHVIVTMRNKMDTDLQENPETHRKEVVKLGLKAIQREGFEYEYDVVATIDLQHELRVTKTRCRALDTYRERLPDGTAFGTTYLGWLKDGTPAPAAPPAAPAMPVSGRPVLIDPEGEPLEDGMVKMLESAFAVTKDVKVAKRATVEELGRLGYPSWESFVAHGNAHYPQILELVQRHDRAKR